MNEALVVDQPLRLWLMSDLLMASIAWSLMCMCWDKENLFHACPGPRQLGSAINHLLYPLLLAFSLAPCWLQRAGSIIKQIKADCWVNFHPILASGCRDVTNKSKSPLEIQRTKRRARWKRLNCTFVPHLMAQFYAALCHADATGRGKVICFQSRQQSFSRQKSCDFLQRLRSGTRSITYCYSQRWKRATCRTFRCEIETESYSPLHFSLIWRSE